MPREITNKTALITGASKRVGRAIALRLASAGVNVIVHYRHSKDEAEELAAEIRALGPQAWTIAADFAVNDDIYHLIERAHKIAGPINILVNNASAFPRHTLANVTFDALMDSIQTDAWAPFALSRSFASKPGAEHIVNLLDTRVFSSYDFAHVAYLSAKHMLGLFTKMLAIKLAPGIAVNGIAPGLILPPEGKGMDYLEALKDEVPLKRIGDPEEVADAVLYLVSSEFITGQVIFVDGGRHLCEVSSG